MTHIFKSILAELSEDVEETEDREPGRPEHNLVHLLNVHHTKDEDELVEDEVPELVLDVL